MKQEMMIYFAEESGEWKMGTINYLSNPEQIKKSPDEKYDTEDSYDMNATTIEDIGL